MHYLIRCSEFVFQFVIKQPEDIERKKTDEPSPDDEQVEGEEAGEDNNKETSEVGPDGDSPVKPRKSKAALEKEVSAPSAITGDELKGLYQMTNR